MKRRDLIVHLHAHGCQKTREGGRHTVYQNSATGRRSAIPRHREINELTVADICKQLGIRKP